MLDPVYVSENIPYNLWLNIPTPRKMLESKLGINSFGNKTSNRQFRETA